ncbi:MAG: hypothetical protein ACPGQS_04005 [Bradymonadia bacterium]
MVKDDKKNSLISPKPVLKKLGWAKEVRRGADESVDEPPMFSSSGTEFELDESLSVDFGWPSLSSSVVGSSHGVEVDLTTEGFVPDITESTDVVGEANELHQTEREAWEVLSDMNTVPRLLIEENDVVWQRLNHREGYVLSQIDGQTSYAELIEIVGLPTEKTKRILVRLLTSGVIG